MSGWNTLKIKDLGRVVTGKTPPTEIKEFFEGEKLFVSPKDLDWDQYYVHSTETRVSEKAFAKFKNQVLPADSVMFTCISFAFGKMGITSRPSLTNQQINAIVVSDDHDFRFVYYLLKAYKPTIFSYNSGIDTPIVPKSVFEGIEVLCPSKPTQQKIAAILSAYDDLIANNQRRITLLERMAEDIYREWFVRLRFPGHEQVKIKKGVPQGWKVLPFSEVVNINPRERINSSVAIPFVPMDALSTSQMYFEVDECRQHASGSKFRNDDVLFPRITPSLENGKRGYVFTLPKDAVGVGSTEFIVFREQELSSEHIYFLTCSPEFRKHAELSMTGASGRQRVSEDCFGFLLVKIPPNELRNNFKSVMTPYFRQIQTLSAALSKLKATRDTLLPRLISGKLAVDALDIHFPPGMTPSA